MSGYISLPSQDMGLSKDSRSKASVSPLLVLPYGVDGCHVTCHDPLKMTLTREIAKVLTPAGE
jgi:hypothetical protein